jgi:2-polyprenyl-3-methyl-5-hydroxy-6-metoxy-1,4-benzoquinol methylase
MWFDPKELLAQQAREIAQVEAGGFSGRGHFGSYYALLKGLNSDWVRSHATVSDQIARSYGRELGHILGSRLDSIRSVLDVGSGVGAITNSLKRIMPKAAVTGIDIAEAGVAYAKQQYPDCTFICASLDADTDLGSRYDLIHCKGLLPFVRTSDVSIHMKYLRACVRHLADGGLFVLVNPDQVESVNGNIKDGNIPYSDLHISKFEIYTMLNWRYSDLVPHRMAAPLSIVAGRVFGRLVGERVLPCGQHDRIFHSAKGSGKNPTGQALGCNLRQTASVALGPRACVLRSGIPLGKTACSITGCRKSW